MCTLSFYNQSIQNQAEDVLTENGFVMLGNGDIITEDLAIYIESTCEYHHIDDTVMTRNGDAILEDDALLCDNCGGYFDCNDYDHVSCEFGTFCDCDCAESEGLFQDENGEWRDQLDDGELRRYSDTNDVMELTTNSHPFRIGFEVEKEDGVLLADLSQSKLSPWIAVSDGSLSHVGFELVSPAYNLTWSDSNMVDDIERLSNYLDGDTDHACGGHITLSEHGVSGSALLARLNDAIPLLYSIFRGRLKNGYSPVKAGKEVTGAKYQAIVNKGNRIEFRLPSRVRTAEQLKLRIELFRYLVSYRTRSTVAFDLNDDNSKLCEILKKMYKGREDKLATVKSLYHDFREYWNDGKISANISHLVPPVPTPFG